MKQEFLQSRGFARDEVDEVEKRLGEAGSGADKRETLKAVVEEKGPCLPLVADLHDESDAPQVGQKRRRSSFSDHTLQNRSTRCSVTRLRVDSNELDV